MTEVNWIARGGAFRTEYIYIYISREHHTIICVVQCIRWRQIKTSASRALYFMHIFERFLPFLSFVCVRCVYSQHTAEERTMRNARWGFIKGKISIYIYVVENRLFIAVELDMNRNHFEWKSKLNWDFDTCHPFRRIHRICIFVFIYVSIIFRYNDSFFVWLFI